MISVPPLGVFFLSTTLSFWFISHCPLRFPGEKGKSLKHQANSPMRRRRKFNIAFLADQQARMSATPFCRTAGPAVQELVFQTVK
jgi:hypothetical protein